MLLVLKNAFLSRVLQVIYVIIVLRPQSSSGYCTIKLR